MDLTNKHSDTVLCSAGKGELPREECFACARAGKQTCGFDYILVRALLDTSERTGIHVTDITGCLRKSWYTKTTTAPEFVHGVFYRVMGTIAHGVLEHHGENDEAEVAVEALGLTGRMDVYRDGRIIDFKSTRWLTPSKLPYGSHELQVNIYAEMLRQNGKEVTSAAIQYIDMSGPTKCRTCKAMYEPDATGGLVCPKCGKSSNDAHAGAVLIEVPLMDRDELQKLIVERRDALLKALQTGKMPRAEPSFLCDYCPFVDICKI
jgi:CRISPR/Cas system-associated exonuclease Cas4 (RecB family)